MLQRIRQRLQDMRTLRQLFTRAEHHARAQGQPRPGAEHFLLAAIELPDGTARRAFEHIGANPDAIPAAIEQQYRDALAQVGIQADMPPASPLTAPSLGPSTPCPLARAWCKRWPTRARASRAPCWARMWWRWSQPHHRAWPHAHCRRCAWTWQHWYRPRSAKAPTPPHRPPAQWPPRWPRHGPLRPGTRLRPVPPHPGTPAATPALWA